MQLLYSSTISPHYTRMQATERERQPFPTYGGAAMLSRFDLRGWPAGVEKHTRSTRKRRAIFRKDDHNPALASRERMHERDHGAQ